MAMVAVTVTIYWNDKILYEGDDYYDDDRDKIK